MLEIKSITDYATKGLLGPENRMVGFGDDTPNTAVLNFATEATEGRFYSIAETAKAKVGTDFELPSKCGDMKVSVITGMPLVGWALSPAAAECGQFEYGIGTNFHVSTRLHFTFFPAFEAYVIQPDQEDIDYSKSTINLDSNNRVASTDFDVNTSVPVDLAVSIAPADLKLCHDIKRYRCMACVEVQDSENKEQLVTVLLDTTAVKVKPGTKTWVKLEDLFGYIKPETPTHTAELQQGEIPVKVTFFDWISEWQLYPKMVYFTEEDEDSSEEDNQG